MGEQYFQMEDIMRDNGNKVKEMDLGKKFFKMEIFTSGNLNKTNKKEKANLKNVVWKIWGRMIKHLPIYK
jgi:hypothetical protein